MPEPEQFDRSVDVVIVGGGPVGLLLSAELGSRGLAVLVIEQKAGLIAHPKANTHNARSMEIYRKHGLADEIRRSGLPSSQPTDVAYFTRLFDRELHRVALPSPMAAIAELHAPDTRWPSAEPQLRVTQMVLEPLLLKRAMSFPTVQICFGETATEISEDAYGVTLTSQSEDGTRVTTRAAFAVGCDGGRSWLRRELNIAFKGARGLEMEFLGGKMQATYFRAPQIQERFPHPPTWMHWTMHPQGRAILVLIDPDKHEYLLHYQSPADGSKVDFGAKLASVLGAAISYDILSAAEWRAGIGVVAEHFRQGRSFLAGDAAHLLTPTGGFGLNTGIEDAFNLGWKLALAVRGGGGSALLDSYEAERRPIASRNIDYALQLAASNGRCPVSPDIDRDDAVGEVARAETAAHLAQFARWEFDTPGIQLGGRYDASPIVAVEAGTPPPDSPTDYIPSARPGGRLPHAWLSDGASLFDRLGPDFTLIDFGNNDLAHWIDAARELLLDLTVLPLGADEIDPALYGAEMVLVRPDHYVAWRGRNQADASQVLKLAVGIA